jgi:hypothetical protein
MKETTLDPTVYEKCNEAVFVSGCLRSGTTILAKTIHSFKNVELAFEPPTLFSSFSLMDGLNDEQFKILYGIYLYEEFLMNALAGRGINCNRGDDSSIYNVKSEETVNARLKNSFGKVDTQEQAKLSTIALKIPSIIGFLPRLKQIFPGTKVVVITRRAEDVFHSILVKGWFRSDVLKEKNLHYPNRIIEGLRIPFWVDSKDDQLWFSMDELSRVAYYYVMVNRAIGEIPECITIKYDDLIDQPDHTVRQLVDSLSLSYGEKSQEIIQSIHRSKKNRNPQMADNLEPKLREEVKYYSNLS